jgi:hypothetical protein
MSEPALEAAAAPTIVAELDTARLGYKLTVTVAAGSTDVSVWRVSTASGNLAYVRGYSDRPLSGQTTVLLYDWEVPLGVEVVYYAQSTVAGVSSAVGQAGPFTVEDDRDWLVDLARPTNSFPIYVEALPELAFEGSAGVHRVLNRRDPILTTSPLWTPSGTLSFVTHTRLERDRARAVLGAGVAFLLRTPPDEGVGNIYLGTTKLSEQRLSRLALHDDRRFVVEVVQVARPDPSVFTPVPPLTYAERKALYPLYSDATATGMSYQSLAYSGGVDTGVDPFPDWLPDDV